MCNHSFILVCNNQPSRVVKANVIRNLIYIQPVDVYLAARPPPFFASFLFATFSFSKNVPLIRFPSVDFLFRFFSYGTVMLLFFASRLLQAVDRKTKGEEKKRKRKKVETPR